MFFSRNIGLISELEQDKICQSCVLIAGVGGMGGVAAEVLVRMGVGSIKLCDPDVFEETNFNRQLHSNRDTLGRHKVEVLKEEFLKINPDLKIEINRDGVNRDNIHQLLDGAGLVINGMDRMFDSLILERTARLKKLTIVDAWLTPYASVFVMKPESPHWEEFLDLPTNGIPLEEITEEICRKAVEKEIEYTFSHFKPFDIINPGLVSEIANDQKARPSLAPVVWLSGVLMANEAVKIITAQPHTDHAGVFYNQYDHLSMEGNIKIRKFLKVA